MPPALSRRRSTCVLALVCLVVAGGCARTGREPAAAAQPGYEVAGAWSGTDAAVLTVADAASRVEVRIVDLPGLLYRITTPSGSGLAPQVTGVAGEPTLRLRATGADGPDSVVILLNRSVRWAIRLPAGGGEEHLELRGGRISALELGAAGLVQVGLPAPVGLVPVTLRSGIGAVEFAGSRGTALRLLLRGGAGTAVTPWAAPRAVAPGGVIGSPGWATRADRYAVEARGGVGSVTLLMPGPW